MSKLPTEHKNSGFRNRVNHMLNDTDRLTPTCCAQRIYDLSVHGKVTGGKTMTPFVNPRSDPDPKDARPPSRTTEHPDDLAELHRFCREMRLYDVERWILAGKPLQMAEDSPPAQRSGPVSALEIALEDGNQALTLLLLCNGYDSNLEYQCPLDRALSSRRWDLLDMLLEWGTDPLRVDPYAVLDTYQSGLFERFRGLGVDLTAGHALADTLAHHTRNKPLYGWAKRHRDDPVIQTELNMALGHHAEEGNERGVALCLWAGAGPHAPAPNLRWNSPSDEDDADEEDRFLGWTAVYEACSHGHVEILKKLGPDPAIDDFEELYEAAYSGSVVQVLAALAPPNDASAVIRHQLWRLCPPFRNDRWQVMSAIRAVFEIPVRWESASAQDIAAIRRELLRCPWNAFVDVLKLLATADHVAPEILKEVGRTPAFRRRMKDVCFIPSGPE